MYKRVCQAHVCSFYRFTPLRRKNTVKTILATYKIVWLGVNGFAKGNATPYCSAKEKPLSKIKVVAHKTTYAPNSA
jgi:hypothetical protein